MKKLLMLIVFLFFGITIQNAFGCSCIKKDSLEEAYSKADIIVQGLVVRAELVHLSNKVAINQLLESGTPLDSIDSHLTDFPMVKVLVEIEKIYKGSSNHDTLTIYTGNSGGNCGFEFITGHNYIIFAQKESYFGESFNMRYLSNSDEFYWVDMCTRTNGFNFREISALEEFIKKLEKE